MNNTIVAVNIEVLPIKLQNRVIVARIMHHNLPVYARKNGDDWVDDIMIINSKYPVGSNDYGSLEKFYENQGWVMVIGRPHWRENFEEKQK